MLNAFWRVLLLTSFSQTNRLGPMSANLILRNSSAGNNRETVGSQISHLGNSSGRQYPYWIRGNIQVGTFSWSVENDPPNKTPFSNHLR